MASFLIEDFVGNGSLKELLPKLLEEGWDDVPTLKVMNSEDMDDLGMTRPQKDGLEIRSYLHDRGLMQYGDKLESSGKCLPELLSISTVDLYSQFGMKRGHIARFMDRTSACGIDPLPASYSLPARKRKTIPSRNNSMYTSELSSVNSIKLQSVTKFPGRSSAAYDLSLEQSMDSFKIKEGHVFKGIVAAMPAEPRACGCVQPPEIVENVAAYSAIENISIQKLTPEYKIGVEHLVKTRTPPMKASELWREKPAILLCIRRPWVKDFWPRYWGGVVLFDRGMEFFKALGGGKLLKDKFISGFLFNPRAIANYKRAKAMGVDQNFKGEGEIKGGLFIVGKGKSGIAYQFIERNFGDWAPLAEVVEICTYFQNQQKSQLESTKSIQEEEQLGF
ncbi:Uncharacterized protein Adt_03793 [Abeliophyllum distichum]|uniref:Peroxiredoxin-like 2A n=1 Tax=Abeliophyllum distichum TaxID=126358 RepID=A0ABD1VZX7_9LAMI